MRELSLLTFSGPNQPSLVPILAAILAEHSVNVLDMDLSVTHRQVNLGILVEVPAAAAVSALHKDILFAAHGLELRVRFQDITLEAYEQWVAEHSEARHMVTLLARKIHAEHIGAVAEVTAEHGLTIERVERLSGRVSLQSEQQGDGRECLEIATVGEPADMAKLHTDLLELSGRLDVDIAVQADDIYRKTRRLVCFDMDSTLIEVEVIDELAKAAGVGEQVAAVTERAMRGELDFNESFSSRLATLRGLDESVLAAIAEALPITEGAERLIATLKTMGYKTAILSGGFTYFARHLQQKLGIDYVYANELAVAEGKVTGEVQGEIINGERKAELLRELASREGLTLQQVIAVGDGANDIPMLSIAGLGIAFRAKPVVRAKARHAISKMGLDALLYLIGYRD
ncbi:phosphoserine phosphatase SerB [Halioxenophilus sp. WMMB6]|uniref:phosphoserine phosphatase SerB n=1 Tax=Halioxenophilus sp. WMMB6 TaxID=3073815 RepID=UPI00295F16C5|nr:phosphoserine phosphatase SerB [Halioxenophilus sp. WMMB6]